MNVSPRAPSTFPFLLNSWLADSIHTPAWVGCACNDLFIKNKYNFKYDLCFTVIENTKTDTHLANTDWIFEKLCTRIQNCANWIHKSTSFLPNLCTARSNNLISNVKKILKKVPRQKKKKNIEKSLHWNQKNLRMNSLNTGKCN